MSSSGAVSAKTARACDYCICRRARWYCAADDAFLCQGCDGSVHSANAVARRHERLRLSTASSKPSIIPSWHRGPHRRARTPRHAKHLFNKLLPTTTITTTTTNTTNSQDDENEDSDPLELLYRVPVLDPFVAELCSSTAGESDCTELIVLREDGQDQKCNNNEASFLPVDLDMDLDMAEFAADVESLLGKGFDGESYVINEGVGLLDCHGRGQLVKAEEEEEETVPFDLCFDYNSLGSCEEADAAEPVVRESQEEKCRTNDDEKREWRISLRLDYEAISAAWASQGSPWMNGERPHINPNDCLFLHGTMGLGTIGEQEGVIRDGGREARVLRYREKRRTRLFSKTIRYEVRKLNAEKRPRMKGRFVKRSSLLTQ